MRNAHLTVDRLSALDPWLRDYFHAFFTSQANGGTPDSTLRFAVAYANRNATPN